ncbi:hypothetical protein J6590_039237 [Homalodisca vitripennis]|nr:hypothetical protein J6590_039237 [Homalodisca vitripennis]
MSGQRGRLRDRCLRALLEQLHCIIIGTGVSFPRPCRRKRFSTHNITMLERVYRSYLSYHSYTKHRRALNCAPDETMRLALHLFISGSDLDDVKFVFELLRRRRFQIPGRPRELTDSAFGAFRSQEVPNQQPLGDCTSTVWSSFLNVFPKLASHLHYE